MEMLMMLTIQENLSARLLILYLSKNKLHPPMNCRPILLNKTELCLGRKD